MKTLKLKIKLNDEKIGLLFRSALVDDASNINEQLAALKADISVDDDEVRIALDDDLWEDCARTPTVNALAAHLGMELEWVGTVNGFPFAWPDAGKLFNNTGTYFGEVMSMYHRHTKEAE